MMTKKSFQGRLRRTMGGALIAGALPALALLGCAEAPGDVSAGQSAVEAEPEVAVEDLPGREDATNDLPEAAEAAAAIPSTSRNAIMDRAKKGKGYSYWWGHARWRSDGAQKGTCSGGTHRGSYGADCSGFVSKAWQVPRASPLTQDFHGPNTGVYYAPSRHWSTIARSAAQKGDAFVYHRGGAGHIFLFEKKNTAGNYVTWECKGCASNLKCDQYVRRPSSVGSAYKAIRRARLVAPTTTTDEVAAEPEAATDEVAEL